MSKKNMPADTEMYLKAELYGRMSVCGIMFLILIISVLVNKRDRDSANMERQVKEFMTRQPNWADSISAYDAKNADNIMHLQNIVSFLDVNPMPNVNSDSLRQELATKRAGRIKLQTEQARANHIQQRYMDSIRQANKYNIFVRNASMRYPR